SGAAERLHARDQDHQAPVRQRRRHQPEPAPGRGERPLQGGQRVARLHAHHLRVVLFVERTAMQNTSRTDGTRLASEAGYSLAEFVVSMGIMTVVMGATMGGLADITKGNDAVLQMTTMNTSLRAGMDLIVRDLLQVGSGLPPGHTITIPNGGG